MIALDDLRFDLAQCAVELEELAQFLASTPALPERQLVLPFFRARPQLAATLGSYHPRIATLNRLAYELSLFGTYAPDMVIGDWERKSFCFVEFESGTTDSIFTRSPRGARRWSPRFEHGFSQICDWSWKLDDLQGTAAFAEVFGASAIDVCAVLVVGRDAGLSDGDRHRLRWRWQHVLIDSQQVYCCTFDQLERDLRQRLALFTHTARID